MTPAAALAAAFRASAARLSPTPSPTDDRAPRETVARFGKAQLFRYRAEGPIRRGPLLIVYGLVGRSTLVDMERGRSLVRNLLAQGVDLYLIDWGEVTRADRHKAFEDYIDGPLADAVTWLRREAGAPTLLGICEGGVFSAIYAALYPQRIAGLALAITPIDFKAGGAAQALARRIRRYSIAEIDALIDAYGGVPGPLMSAAFLRLDPARAMARFAVDLPAAMGDPDRLESFLRMEAWLSDRPDHPGGASRQWLVDLYHENRLAEGRLMIGDRRVDLGDIRAPTLNIYGARDHIAPSPSVTALGPLVGGPYRELAVDAGHAGVIVGRGSQPIVAPAITAWMDEFRE